MLAIVNSPAFRMSAEVRHDDRDGWPSRPSDRRDGMKETTARWRS